MIADHDHAVAGEELGALAVGRQEGALLAFKSLRAVDGHAFARAPVRPALRPGARSRWARSAIDVDQALAGMLGASSAVAVRQQPALRVLVENDEILGRRDADDDLAQLAPLVVGARSTWLDPGVDVFVADDVVFLEIVAGLDLDDLEQAPGRDWRRRWMPPIGM